MNLYNPIQMANSQSQKQLLPVFAKVTCLISTGSKLFQIKFKDGAQLLPTLPLGCLATDFYLPYGNGTVSSPTAVKTISLTLFGKQLVAGEAEREGGEGVFLAPSLLVAKGATPSTHQGVAKDQLSLVSIFQWEWKPITHGKSMVGLYLGCQRQSLEVGPSFGS